MNKNNRNKKTTKIALLVALVAIFASVVGFFIYTSIYYHADQVAMEVYQEGLESGMIVSYDNMTIIEPEAGSGIGIIFYPGAKVEAIAYLPLLQQLADVGFTTVLLEMPFNMAIFDVDGADDVFALLEENQDDRAHEILQDVSQWYIMGHSMGGAMASSYASDHQELVEGLILIGAYVYGEYPTEKALTIYGTFNDNLEENIDYTDNIVIIQGGNHAQYGNYGEQSGDPQATISDVEQQAITVEAIVEFVANGNEQ
ncbi:MAG: alpha/beta fold hydrolase [Eubacteriales bacterium]